MDISKTCLVFSGHMAFVHNGFSINLVKFCYRTSPQPKSLAAWISSIPFTIHIPPFALSFERHGLDLLLGLGLGLLTLDPKPNRFDEFNCALAIVFSYCVSIIQQGQIPAFQIQFFK